MGLHRLGNEGVKLSREHIFSCAGALNDAGTGRNKRGNVFNFQSFNWISFKGKTHGGERRLRRRFAPYWNCARRIWGFYEGRDAFAPIDT